MRRFVLTVGLAALVVLSGPVLAPQAGADAGELARARARADRAAAELAEAETVLGELEAEIQTLEARAAEAQGRINELRDAVRELAVRRYINADAAQLTYLDPDINVQARADTLGRYATQGNQDALDDFIAASEDLEIAQRELEEKRAAQADAIDELAARRKALEAEFKRLEKLERERQEAERKRREAAAKAAREAAAKEAAAKAAAGRPGGGSSRAGGSSGPSRPANPVPSPPAAGGGIICPVQGPVAFSDTWGAPRSGGRSHKGVDMLAPIGTPTVAPVSGYVTHRGNTLGGLSWHLQGDDGTYYYGTHLSAYANVGAGHVEAGTVIGYVGDTGNARGTPHLHFEMHPGGRGRAINPYPYVRAAC
ncbi:MAG TPA: peptidoglycan DD-metalloendopeptidase family protein [Acidimicrobiales bacterium]|nr:peptidoglycan DD-metalloendopeptidase family protein [Acidimicrobiales bacterium]